MDSTENYTVTHDCGDPREPEYKNGLIVSRAQYQESQIYILYIIYGKKAEKSELVTWFLQEPRDLRARLGKKIYKREEIANRTIKYLRENDFKSRMPYADFSNIQVDSQQVFTLWQHINDKWKGKIRPYSRYIPSRTTLTLILLCFLLLKLQHMVTSQALDSLNVVCALVIMLSASSDTTKDYKLFFSVFSYNNKLMASGKTNKNITLTALKITLKTYKIKYAISICFVLYFWLYG